LESLKNFKTFFVAGKGGVGKSTTSALLALYFAKRGERVLLASLDPAHSLSLILGRELSSSPVRVYKELFALEVDLDERMKEYLKRVEREAEKVVSPLLIAQIKRQIELAYYSPGANELALLDAIYDIAKREESSYAKLIFDTAPSGYTLRLTSSPKKLISWIDSLISMRREALKLVGREAEEDEIVKRLLSRREEYLFLSSLFSSPETLFGVVVNEGRLPLEIGRRTIEELEKFGAKVRAVFANRFGRPPKKPLFGKPTFWIPPFEREPLGIEALLELLERVEFVGGL